MLNKSIETFQKLHYTLNSGHPQPTPDKRRFHKMNKSMLSCSSSIIW